jgi:hypothetical protein
VPLQCLLAPAPPLPLPLPPDFDFESHTNSNKRATERFWKKNFGSGLHKLILFLFSQLCIILCRVPAVERNAGFEMMRFVEVY